MAVCKNKKQKAVLFENIDYLSLPVALFYFCLGYKVYYGRNTPGFTKKFFKALTFEGIVHAEYQMDTFLHNWSNEITKKIINEPLANNFKRRFKGVAGLGEIHDRAIKSNILKSLYEPTFLHVLADDLSHKYRQITIFHNKMNYLFVRTIDQLSPYKVRTLWLLPMLSGFLQKLFTKENQGRYDISLQEILESEKPSADFVKNVEVLFFSHGITYLKCFNKDQFFSGSYPFRAADVLNLYLDVSNERSNDDKSFCNENGIKSVCFFDYVDSFTTFLISALKESSFRQIKDTGTWILKSPIRGSYLARFYQRVFRSLRAMDRFPNVKMALLGYEILFPPTLSIAMKIKGVKTVATQERLLTGFMRHYPVICDEYFVISPLSSKMMAQQPFLHWIDNFHVVGQVRLDDHYSHLNSSDEKYSALAKGRPIIFHHLSSDGCSDEK